jgi:hypothetical protein
MRAVFKRYGLMLAVAVIASALSMSAFSQQQSRKTQKRFYKKSSPQKKYVGKPKRVSKVKPSNKTTHYSGSQGKPTVIKHYASPQTKPTVVKHYSKPYRKPTVIKHYAAPMHRPVPRVVVTRPRPRRYVRGGYYIIWAPAPGYTHYRYRPFPDYQAAQRYRYQYGGQVVQYNQLPPGAVNVTPSSGVAASTSTQPYQPTVVSTGRWSGGIDSSTVWYSGYIEGSKAVDPSPPAAGNYLPDDLSIARSVFHVGYKSKRNAIRLNLPLLDTAYETEEPGIPGTYFINDQEITQIGDLQIIGSYYIDNEMTRQMSVGLGLSLPTGNDNVEGPLLSNGYSDSGYQIQGGSGTYDPILQFNYQLRKKHWQYGIFAQGILRLSENQHGYSLGNQYQLAATAIYQPAARVSPMLQIQGEWQGKVQGQSTEINPNVAPWAKPGNTGGRVVYLNLGAHFSGSTRMNHRKLELLLGFPVYQYCNGEQLKQSMQFTVNWTVSG